VVRRDAAAQKAPLEDAAWSACSFLQLSVEERYAKLQLDQAAIVAMQSDRSFPSAHMHVPSQSACILLVAVAVLSAFTSI